MTTPPSYLTDHGDAVEEIGTLASKPARKFAPMTAPERPLTPARAIQRLADDRRC